jgi:hypothetical protein
MEEEGEKEEEDEGGEAVMAEEGVNSEGLGEEEGEGEGEGEADNDLSFLVERTLPPPPPTTCIPGGCDSRHRNWYENCMRAST